MPIDGDGLGGEMDSCANKGMIYYHLHNLAFVHTQGQILEVLCSCSLGPEFQLQTLSQPLPAFPQCLICHMSIRVFDLQVLLIGSAETWGQLKIWECVLLAAFEPQTLEVCTGQDP